MAIYQRFDYSKKASTWIMIQVPPELTNELSSIDEHRLKPSEIHERVFSVAEQEWRDYICYLDDEARKLEEKASFVDVEFYSEGDYLIAFADSQKLQRLRRKLVKTKEILDYSLEVASGCETHWQDLQSRFMSDSGPQMADLGCFISRIKMHKLGVEAIQQNIDGIATLLFRILDYRKQDTILKSHEALNRNSESMREIALATKTQQELMAAMLSKSQKDSRTVKILTVIALIYLPASLVAEVFNSNLIQTTHPEEEDGGGGHLALSRSFWIYPLTTFCLMLFTFVPISWLLSRNRRQGLNHKASSG